MFEELKKSTRGGAAPGSRKSPLGVADPKLRLYIMIGAAVVLGAIMLGLDRYADDPKNKAVPDGEPAYDAGPTEAERFSGVPPLDTKYRDKIADEKPKDRVWWQNDVVSYLLYEARNTPAVHTYKTNLFPLHRKAAEEIEKKGSRGWRYRYVQFRGRIEGEIEEINYESVYGEGELEVGQVRRARVLLAGEGAEARVLFFTPMPPTWIDPDSPLPNPPEMAIKSGWVRGRGIFVKRYVDTRGRQEVPCLLVIATDIQRDYEHVTVNTLADIPFGIIRDEWALKDSGDGKTLMGRLFPRPLFRLVQYAAKRAGSAGAELRATEGLKPQSLDDPKKFEKVMTQPAKHRADYFGGLGAIAWAPDPFVAEPNDAGVEEYLTGHIITDKQKLIQFVAPISLGTDWKKRDRIRYEGFLYKTRLYRTVANKDKIVPMLVLTRLERVAPHQTSSTVPVVIAGLFVLGLAALAFLVLREDKTRESFRRQARRGRSVSAKAADSSSG